MSQQTAQHGPRESSVTDLRPQAGHRGLHQGQVRGAAVRAAAVGRGAPHQGGVPQQAGEEAEQQQRAPAPPAASPHPQAEARLQRLREVRSAHVVFFFN